MISTYYIQSWDIPKSELNKKLKIYQLIYLLHP